LYCSGTMCVGFTVWFGRGGVVWYPDAGWSTSSDSACIRIPHHPSRTTPWHQHTSNQSNITHEITQQINRKLLKMDVLTFETCWALNNEIIKRVTSSWSIFIHLFKSFFFLLCICRWWKKRKQLICVWIDTCL
jgi:hypothetical protein